VYKLYENTSSLFIRRGFNLEFTVAFCWRKEGGIYQLPTKNFHI